MKILIISFVELSDSTREEIRKEFGDIELDFTTGVEEKPGWKTVWAGNGGIELIEKQIQNILGFQSLRNMNMF